MKCYWQLLLLVCAFPALAQTGGSVSAITGTIMDEEKKNIPYASIALYNRQDSTLTGGAVSDDHGRFELAARPGSYYLKISFLSFEEKIMDLSVTNQPIDLGVVVLRSGSRLLKEVVVTGEKSQMELQPDKRVFNVAKDLSNAGGTAADVLNNLPSVNVDPDGAVSLRGSENVRILIDGRPSGLTSRDPDGLRKLQGNLVERVEVITNPSSRYDAAGEVGIINIIMKKNQEKGINGVVTANAGYPDFYGGSYTLNIRRKKANLFSSYGIDYRRRPGGGNSFQRFAGTGVTYRQNNERNNSERSHNFIAGLDYFITAKQTLTGSFLYNTGNGLNKSETFYHDYQDGEPLQTTLRTEQEHEDEKNIEGTVNFKQEFAQAGRTFTADFKWIKSVDDEITDYTEGLVGNAARLQHADNLANEINWLVQADYIHPFLKDGKAEMGIKTASRVIRNEFGLQQQDDAGNWDALSDFTNNMVYTERVHAAYAMASNTFGDLAVQGGVRGEYSDITTELTLTNDINPRQYFNLFPSAGVSYAINDNKTLQLSYSYRISRPEFRDLMPFNNFRDSRVFFTGNPNLKPEYTHSIEAGYLLDWKNGSVLSSVYHRHRNNVIQRIVTTPDEEGRTRITPINMASENAYGFEFNVSLNTPRWWRLNTSANVYRAITDGSYEGNALHSDTYTWTTRTTSRITIAKTLNFQTSFNYRAPRITTQGEQRSFYSLDLALSRDVFKGKGTIIANVRDLFNTRKRRSVVDTDEYYSDSVFQGQRRQFTITFTYRINREKERNETRTKNGNDDDSNED